MCACPSVSVSGQQLLNEMSFDGDIWRADSSGYYIGQVRKSRSKEEKQLCQSGRCDFEWGLSSFTFT